MTNEEKLIKKLGFKDVNNDDFDQAEALKVFHEKIKADNFELFKNDTDYKDEIEASARAKILGTMDRDLKKYGLTDDDLKEKKAHEKLKLLFDKAEEKFGKAGDDVKPLQDEIVELKNAAIDKETEYQKSKEDYEKVSDGKLAKDKADLKLNALFYAYPKDQLISKKHSDGMFKALQATIDSSYDARIVDGELSFFDKGTDKRAMGTVDGREAILTTEEILNSTLKDLSFVVESGGGGKDDPKPPDPKGGGGNGKHTESAKVIEMRARIAAQQG